MTLIQLAAVFFALITAIGWLNARVLHLPQTPPCSAPASSPP